MVQGKDTLNEKHILTFRRWFRGPLFFLHQFPRFVLLFLLHHSGKYPSLMIICSLFSILYTPSSSSCFSAKASWAYLEISALPSGGLEIVIADYHSGGELIYHLSGADLLRYIFDLFPTVSFEKLSSLCWNNAAMIASLSVAGEHISRYQAVPLTS